ncbi:MAG: hypothetical protein AB7O24_20550 [Kofleriaceae bacterium]
MVKQAGSPLMEAAMAFDDELAHYMRLGEQFLKTPLDSVKHLERANTTLTELAACEERLQKLGEVLVKAFSIVRDQQDNLAKGVIAHVPMMQARNQKLQELMKEMSGVASEVSSLNAVVLARPENGDTTKPPPVNPNEVSEAVLAVSARAAKLAEDANAAEFEELATQAHALHQRLLAIGKKLRKAST